MKWLLLSLFIGAALFTEGQVVFRNDFIIGRHQKIKNKGLTFITINLDRHPNLNMLINGRGGRSLVIDVAALKNPMKTYSYSELAERIYTPGPVYQPSVAPVPMHLLMEPPPRIKMPAYSSRIFESRL
ncbi:MAG: hypothetical protein HOP08_17530 [Cyclobacteriaceae bacterium]|nr:hypothetical protein [Cyclobacteriaceae bacterium]